MALKVFNFPYHKAATRYPDRGNKMTLGGNWDYTIKPNTPAARTFQLSFSAMKYFDPFAVLSLREQQISMAALEAFYEEHETHTAFVYPHPQHGDVVVKFSAPLEIPTGVTGGDGAVLNISTSLKEQKVT